MMHHPTIKFTYFDKVDRPEPIRLAMMMSDIPFEDNRISQEQWRSLKDKTPFGCLPIMEVDGRVFSHSNALLRYVGHIGSLLPTDPLQALQVDQIIGVIDDIIFAVKPILHIDDRSRKVAELNRLADEFIPRLFSGLDRVLGRGSKEFCVGSQYSIADIALFNLVHWFKTGTVEGISSNIVDKYENICRIYNKVARHQKISHWLEEQRTQ